MTPAGARDGVTDIEPRNRMTDLYDCPSRAVSDSCSLSQLSFHSFAGCADPFRASPVDDLTRQIRPLTGLREKRLLREGSSGALRSRADRGERVVHEK